MDIKQCIPGSNILWSWHRGGSNGHINISSRYLFLLFVIPSFGWDVKPRPRVNRFTAWCRLVTLNTYHLFSQFSYHSTFGFLVFILILSWLYCLGWIMYSTPIELHSCEKAHLTDLYLFTPPRNRGRVIFSLQFVCVCDYLSVCVCVRISCEQIPAEWMNRFGRGFH